MYEGVLTDNLGLSWVMTTWVKGENQKKKKKKTHGRTIILEWLVHQIVLISVGYGLENYIVIKILLRLSFFF